MINKMTPEETRVREQQLLKHLMNVALNRPHTQLSLLESVYAVKAAKLCRKAIRKTVKVFKDMKKETLQKTRATKKQKQFIADLDKCIIYYRVEAELLTDIIKEFRCYTFWNRHTLATLLGRPRAEDEMVDYRTLPTSWF